MKSSTLLVNSHPYYRFLTYIGRKIYYIRALSSQSAMLNDGLAAFMYRKNFVRMLRKRSVNKTKRNIYMWYVKNNICQGLLNMT